jgi:hypothetical protein
MEKYLMPEFKIKKEQVLIIARAGSPEQLVKVEVIDVEAGDVTLHFGTGGKASVHTLEEWERLQSERESGKSSHGAPKRAPYMG